MSVGLRCETGTLALARGVALLGVKVPGPSNVTTNFCDERILHQLNLSALTYHWLIGSAISW